MSLYAVIDPATGATVKEYPTATDEQIEHAVAAAAKTHRQWSRNSTVADRAALIRKVAELHTQRREELAKIIQRGMIVGCRVAPMISVNCWIPSPSPGIF